MRVAGEGRGAGSDGPIALARGAIEWICIAALAAVVLLPLVDIALARAFWSGLPQASSLAEHAVLVLTFLSATLASLEGRHLALSTKTEEPRSLPGRILRSLSDVSAVTVHTGMFWASLSLVFTGFDAKDHVWIIPLRAIAAAMPLSFLLMAVFSVAKAGKTAKRRMLAASGILLGSLLAISPIRNFLFALVGPGATGFLPAAFLDSAAMAVQVAVHAATLPLCLAFIAAAIGGAPLFTAIGGVAIVLFTGSGSYLELAPSEAYALLHGGTITAIPLFALVGFILADSGAGVRLVAVLRGLFGWVRGGEAVVAVLACAFFTTFTGANGVTILALGGILAAALAESGAYSVGAARGLIAASGAIGLLLPPSAAVIVYGINAQFVYGDGGAFDVSALFRGGFLPGIVLVLAMCAGGVLAAKRGRGARSALNLREARAALKPAILELLVPLIAALLFFTGFAGLPEIGAICVLYIVVVETFVKRKLNGAALLASIRSSLPVLGGTLIILAAARGLSFFIIDADIPSAFTAWVSARVSSPLVFLIALNILLLITGCFMDIYSAILVVAPLVIPLGAAYGIDPVHFGVIFILNLCIGFITPPVGMNLFLASYAFRQPMTRIVREVLPFLAIQLAVLFLVTYGPLLWRLVF